MISQFNITAQIYNKNDRTKQTILMNNIIESTNQQSAIDMFKLKLISENDILVQILSVEKISQDCRLTIEKCAL